MKRKHFILDVISFIITIFNIICVVCFFLPPGRAYYMPEILMNITQSLTTYAFLGGMAKSGIVGMVLNVIAIVYKKKKQISIKNNIIYLIMFALTIPWAWLLFIMAMSV